LIVQQFEEEEEQDQKNFSMLEQMEAHGYEKRVLV